MQYISPIRYGLEALVRNEYEGKVLLPNEPNPIEYLGFNIGMANCIIILVGITVILRLLSFVFLKIMVS